MSQVHLELDGIRFDLGQQGPEALFCEPCRSAAFECQQSCAEFLFEQEHHIAGGETVSALIFLLVARKTLQC